jgi:hypothetical protein
MTKTTRILGFAVATLAVAGFAGCVDGQLGLSRAEMLDHAHVEMTASTEDVTAGWTRDGEWLVSPVLEAPDGASRAGALVGLASPGDLPGLEARVLVDGQPAGDWQPLGETWGEEDQHVAVAELGGTGDGAQLRIRAEALEVLRVLQWTAVIPEPDAGDDGVPLDEVAGASAALRSELGGLGIVTRSSWGARATRCTARDARKTRLAIHHTVSGASDPARQLRGIQRYHMDTNGWCDVGYHFLIGQDGRVYEGRPLELLGSHVGGNNTGNIGISYIGCFHTSGCSGLGPTTPTGASVEIGGRLVGTLARLYGVTIDGTRIKGHGQHPGQSTSCPGANLRSRVADIVSTARTRTLASSSPSPAPAPAPAPAPSGASCTHTYGGRYGNTACSAGYQCCDGRWSSRGACGACACVETTGERGCGMTSPAPAPTGAACTHSYGGRYGSSACSASYQCCDGRWRSRGACGGCACVETTGERGCGL